MPILIGANLRAAAGDHGRFGTGRTCCLHDDTAQLRDAPGGIAVAATIMSDGHLVRIMDRIPCGVDDVLNG